MLEFYTTTYPGNNIPDFIYHVYNASQKEGTGKAALHAGRENIEGKIKCLLDNAEIVLRELRPNIFTDRKQNS